MIAPVLLLVNPSAGGGRAGRLASDVLERLRGEGLQARSELTRDIAHARELAHSAALAGEVVACLGGDGLFGAVADRVREVPGAMLAVLPGGRGNDLARVLGIGQDPVAACGVLARGVARKLDLGEVEGKAFVGIASAGFAKYSARRPRMANALEVKTMNIAIETTDVIFAIDSIPAAFGVRRAQRRPGRRMGSLQSAQGPSVHGIAEAAVTG